MLLATALALLITGCAQQTFTVQNKPAAVAPKKPSPIISSFLEIGQKKTVDAAKICGGAENVVKTGNPANIRKWIARFYYFRHLYSAGSAVCIAHNNCELPIDMGNSIYCSLIYFWVPSSCFCIVISLSWGWNNPVQRCLPVGGRLHYPRRRRVVACPWLTDCFFDVQPTTTSGNIITQSIIFALASANSFVYFASSAATSRWRICMSTVIAAFAASVLWHFCRAGLCR